MQIQSLSPHPHAWKRGTALFFSVSVCETDRPVFLRILGQSRCRDMSSENADLDEIGSFFCRLNQWIVSGPPSKRQSGEKIKHCKRCFYKTEARKKSREKSIPGSCCLLGANGWGRWCVVMLDVSLKRTAVRLTSVEDQQELLYAALQRRVSPGVIQQACVRQPSQKLFVNTRWGWKTFF